MIAGLGIPMRSGGELIIDRSDVNSTKASQGSISAKLERIWDHIKDWFYNTNLVEAKQQLFVLHDPKASVAEKAGSFLKLKDLVGEGYRDRFEMPREALGYKLIINYGDGIEPYNQSIAVCNQDYLRDQLNAGITATNKDDKVKKNFRDLQDHDLLTATYSIAGNKLGDFRPSEPDSLRNLRRFHYDLGRSFKPTTMQHAAIDTMANRNLLRLLQSASSDSNGGVFSLEDLDHTPAEAANMTYDFTSNGEDIELHFNYTSDFPKMSDMQPDAPQRSIFMEAPVYDARILIGPTGNVTVLSAVSGIAPL